MQVKAALTAYMQNKELYGQLKRESREATGILDKNLAERRETSSQNGPKWRSRWTTPCARWAMRSARSPTAWPKG